MDIPEKKCWHWANEKFEPKSCPELTQNKQTRTKFNEAIASMIEDHKTKMQNSGERWQKIRKRRNCAQEGKYIKLTKLYIYIIFRFFSITDYYKILIIIPCDIHRSLLFIYFIYSSIYSPEITILSEVSQREKDKCHVISLVCGI